MKISTKGRYGLRALVDLASHTRDCAISLVNVAQRQKISLNYLEQVFATLRKAGIVRSVKGAQGGYMLAKDPAELTVGEIITALEGKFSIIDEAHEGGEQKDYVQQSIQEMVWDRINTSVNTYLDETTLEQLVEQYEKLNQDEVMMYYI